MKTSKKLWAALLVSFLLVLGVSGFIVSQVLCQTIDKEQIISPDGRLTVERYTVDCGARNRARTYVNMFKTLRTSAKEDDGETIAGVPGLARQDDLIISWTATDTLKIIYKEAESMKIVPTNKFGVKIVTGP